MKCRMLPEGRIGSSRSFWVLLFLFLTPVLWQKTPFLLLTVRTDWLSQHFLLRNIMWPARNLNFLFSGTVLSFEEEDFVLWSIKTLTLAKSRIVGYLLIGENNILSEKSKAFISNPKSHHNDSPNFSCLKPHTSPVNHKSNQSSRSNQIRSNNGIRGLLQANWQRWTSWRAFSCSGTPSKSAAYGLLNNYFWYLLLIG